jgi:hypothetical protein
VNCEDSVQIRAEEYSLIEGEITRRFHSDLKRYFVLRSAARRRLVKTQNPSTCATVNCKMCKSAIALY